MNIRALLVSAAVCWAWQSASATGVGTRLVFQPAYLGTASQPDRIPLAPVICNANYTYGLHGVIFASRPCYHGHFNTDTRPEYEQNLAVLYGISCSLSDPTQIPGSVATFSVRKAQPPTNAPYTQEQVLAASLQTLLIHACGMSKSAPLTVAIKGDGIPQPAWAAKYAKPYFHTDEELARQRKGETAWKPLSVPGIRIDDASVPGVTYLVIEGVKPDPTIRPMEPVFVPSVPEGDSDPDAIWLVPVWPGNSWGEALGVLNRPELPYYQLWRRSGTVTTEPDASPYQPPPNPMLGTSQLTVVRGKSGCSVRIQGGEITPERFAALVFSCLATVRPTPSQPLELVLSQVDPGDGYRKLLKQDAAWQDGTPCRLVLDPKTLKLQQGSVPGYKMKSAGGYLKIHRVGEE